MGRKMEQGDLGRGKFATQLNAAIFASDNLDRHMKHVKQQHVLQPSCYTVMHVRREEKRIWGSKCLRSNKLMTWRLAFC